MSWFTKKIATVDNAIALLNKTITALDDVAAFQVAESDKQRDTAYALRQKADQAELAADAARQEAQRAESIKRNLSSLLV